MSKRGPAPRPTMVRILHGDRKDRVNDTEPVPPVEEVACPESASGAARSIWDRVAPGLMRRGVQLQAEAERTFLQFAARFGLIPSDRRYLKTEGRADQRAAPTLLPELMSSHCLAQRASSAAT